ncbi:hypothetical protein DPMN_143457 [Dreissena polymorpha]|uniref:Uncharacterized protein n=1 Tax=Dreissena polymorpha TaxID=45954 RepID=A0A9D4JLQ0_DREPO|nr:hypothetical protein DPMN_143457 [Dreissena polymorpha]
MIATTKFACNVNVDKRYRTEDDQCDVIKHFREVVAADRLLFRHECAAPKGESACSYFNWNDRKRSDYVRAASSGEDDVNGVVPVCSGAFRCVHLVQRSTATLFALYLGR